MTTTITNEPASPKPAPIGWVETWEHATKAYWPNKKPEPVRFLLLVARGVVFRAPEVMGIDVRRAWEVYQDVGDTEEGRCAVALAYAIQEDARREVNS